MEITFIHSDNKQYTFKAEFNELSGNWLYTWDNWQGCFVAENKSHINAIVKGIKEKAMLICNICGDRTLGKCHNPYC